MFCHRCGSTVPERAVYCPECGSMLRQLPVTQGVRVTQEVPKQTCRRRGKVFLAIVMFLLVNVFEVIGYVIGSAVGLDPMVTAYVGGAAGSVVGMLALGWLDLVRPRASVIKESLRMGWWLLACDVLLIGIEVVASIAEGEWRFASGWPLRTLGLLVMCLAIGICEEGMFRGLLFGGLLSRKGATDADVQKMAIISSAAFGLAHVEWWAMDYSDPMSWTQAILKVLQTGILGLFFTAVVVKTRSITGCMLLHGVSNFMLMVTSVGLMDYTPDVEYVTTGPDAVMVVVTYVLVIVMYVPLLVRAIRVFRKPCTSPFTR